MSDLKSGFESLGLARVSTYKASGNVIFESESAPQAEYLDKKLGRALGVKAPILLRSIEEVRSIVDLNPFKDSKADPPKFYVTFMAQDPQKKVKIPVLSQKGDVELIHRRNLDIFSISHSVKGSFGFPNSFIESSFEVIGTTRDWKTVIGLSEIQKL